MAEAMPTSTRRNPRSKANGGRFTLSVTLTTGIGLLLVVAVLTVLGIGLWSARKNTLTLLSAQARLAISSSIAQIDQHLKPAVDQTEVIAELIVAGELDPGDNLQFTAMLTGALASAPQIKGLVFLQPSHQMNGVQRAPDGKSIAYGADLSADPVVRRAVAALAKRPDAVWGEPVWRKNYATTFLNLRTPVHRGDQFVGALVALISIGELSSYLAGLTDALGNNAWD